MLDELGERYSRRRRYLVGVSGGVDSVVLLDLLAARGFEKLVVCHLNHGLRGVESGRDATFVRALAKRHGLPVEVAKADVEGMAWREKDSIETAARKARLAFFAALARKWRCNRVMLAHHADDQVETVLMNVFRGAGLEGLEGMREETEMVVGRRKLVLMRPLLGVGRSDIEEYAVGRRLKHREDASNLGYEFLRNRVRGQLIPELRRGFGRDVRGAVLRMAGMARDENVFVQELVDEFPWEEDELSVPALRQLPVALQRRVIRRWMRSRGVVEVGFRTVDVVRGLLEEGSRTAKVNLPGGRHARRRAKKLFLE
ncbi:MAG: tRNA lysidine(34) synthetase TilS [Verrucomicrobiota bacterium]